MVTKSCWYQPVECVHVKVQDLLKEKLKKEDGNMNSYGGIYDIAFS